MASVAASVVVVAPAPVGEGVPITINHLFDDDQLDQPVARFIRSKVTEHALSYPARTPSDNLSCPSCLTNPSHRCDPTSWRRNRACMMRLLRREEQLRHSFAQQTLFALAEREENVWQIDWLDLVEVLQAFVVAETMSSGNNVNHLDSSTTPRSTSTPKDIRAAVEILRVAHVLYPDDAEMRAVSVYHRANVARQGTLQVNDEAPGFASMPLVPLDGGNSTTLTSFVNSQLPVCIIASSIS